MSEGDHINYRVIVELKTEFDSTRQQMIVPQAVLESVSRGLEELSDPLVEISTYAILFADKLAQKFELELSGNSQAISRLILTKVRAIEGVVATASVPRLKIK